jgi:hypothetical protein
MTSEQTHFISGLVAMGFLVGAGFFLRFWRRTKDGLFAAFALAFFLLALSQTLGAWLNLPFEERTWLFLIRFAAFSLIIGAILRKNFSK